LKSPTSARERASHASVIAWNASQEPTTIPLNAPVRHVGRWRLRNGLQDLARTPVVAERVTREPEIVACVELERKIFGACPLGPALVRRAFAPHRTVRSGGSIRQCGWTRAPADESRRSRWPWPQLPAGTPASLELAQRVKGPTEIDAHIDLLLSPFGSLRQLA
jgi:hypothetical protein